ncbi:MAG: hypothetical protein HY248_00230 [Fimbriimonas ginsengisoli]|uniref:Uncharacterized protein n=1 Tax=Fimbriimonas ginsengisoli TaxID=1005039 RepID=A0A931LVR8_FIMGI|nr:hypothetical protein [Fimbriimonas ginsengisoli]MBI3720951.1 hypothetical protein [Fimbriimonas ginsengisoli]
MIGRRDLFGSILGILVFLGGVALLLITFREAYRMFSVPAGDALGVHAGATVDLNRAGSTFVGLIVRILLLVVMAIVSSLIANRGIQLYASSRALRTSRVPELSDEEARFVSEGGHERAG